MYYAVNNTGFLPMFFHRIMKFNSRVFSSFLFVVFSVPLRSLTAANSLHCHSCCHTVEIGKIYILKTRHKPKADI